MLSALFLAVYVTTATTQKFMSTPSTFWRPPVGTTSLRPWQIPNPVSSVPWRIPIPESEAPFSFWYPPSARGQPNYLMAKLLPERGAADFVTVSSLCVYYHYRLSIYLFNELWIWLFIIIIMRCSIIIIFIILLITSLLVQAQLHPNEGRHYIASVL